MANSKYTDEFKQEAVKQVTERGFTRKEVAERLGVSVHSLYRWIEEISGKNLPHGNSRTVDKDTEIAKLKSEVKRLTEERDILKKAAAFFANNPE